MQEYESRIIRPNGAIVLIAHGSHLNDFGAIRAAQKLRREGELAEVWKGQRCVYSECPSHTADVVWPIQDKVARG